MECKACGGIIVLVSSQYRGLCSSCYEMKASFDTNDKRMGVGDNLPTFGFEFEVVGPYTEEAHPHDLIAHGFVRCADCTVQDELKSPIYESLEAFLPTLKAMEGMEYAVTNTCGTHVHVGISEEASARLRHQKEHVLHKLNDHLEECDAQTEEFFGRYFCNWADRSGWICRKPHYGTLEYRLPRFRSTEQFLAVIVFLRDLTAYLDAELRYARSPEAYERISTQVLNLYTQHVERSSVRGLINHCRTVVEV